MNYVFGGICFMISLAFYVKAVVTLRRIQDEVNSAVPVQLQIPESASSLRRTEMLELHKKNFPESCLRTELHLFWAGNVIAFLCAIACVVTIK